MDSDDELAGEKALEDAVNKFESLTEDIGILFYTTVHPAEKKDLVKTLPRARDIVPDYF